MGQSSNCTLSHICICCSADRVGNVELKLCPSFSLFFSAPWSLDTWRLGEQRSTVLSIWTQCCHSAWANRLKINTIAEVHSPMQIHSTIYLHSAVSLYSLYFGDCRAERDCAWSGPWALHSPLCWTTVGTGMGKSLICTLSHWEKRFSSETSTLKLVAFNIRLLWMFLILQ